MLVQTSEQRALLRVRENIRENHKTREGGAIIRLEKVRRTGVVRFLCHAEVQSARELAMTLKFQAVRGKTKIRARKRMKKRAEM